MIGWLAGFDLLYEGGADDLKVSRWDLEAFLKDARVAFPHANLTAGDVRMIHRGLLPRIGIARPNIKSCSRCVSGARQAIS